LSPCFGDHDVQQRAKVGGPHVVDVGENSADLLGFGRRQSHQNPCGLEVYPHSTITSVD
jgi:hypothetical protein